MALETRDFWDAVQVAERAHAGDDNYDEIDALWYAIDVAKELIPRPEED